MSGRIAVIDIGSNSIRLVVFDRLRRVPAALFNEKVICALGRGLSETGRLSQESMDRALQNLVRFVRMADGMGVEQYHLVATAAAREAENGADFLTEVEARCGQPVRLLSGDEEARISALGVLSAMPDAEGVMGDLGGGSLELVSLEGGRTTASATLPLGLLRLGGHDQRERKTSRKLIDEALASLDWLQGLEGRRFYAVGGAWRSLARVHMAQIGYPLRVIHSYRIHDPQQEDMLKVLGRLSDTSLLSIRDVSRERLATLPLAALLMRRVVRLLRPSELVFSSYGLREGYLYGLLDAEPRSEDPLLASTADVAARESRFGSFGETLFAWSAALFCPEAPAEARLRRAVCHLSDMAWREHTDYRANQALSYILHYPFTGVNHQELGFIAYAVYIRYGGRPTASEARMALALLSPEAAERARQIGLALRLAYSLSAGTAALLNLTGVKSRDGRLCLTLPAAGPVLQGEVVERRFSALTRSLNFADYRIETV